MKWGEWFEKWSMTSLKVKAPFLEMDWAPKDEDKDAAWELYTELLTRTTTQPLPIEHGDENVALNSVHDFFSLTRAIIKSHGRHCNEFTKIAVVILNQKVRPFTTKWHKPGIETVFDDPEQCKIFREDLTKLQGTLRTYSRMLADMAGVEDLTELEEEE